MSSSKFMTAAQAVQLIRDNDTVGLMGGGGGLMEATHVFEAVQARFLATQTPRNLSVVHALGIGDKKTKGMNCFAHEGLVRKVIGGHWVWSPAMQQLALDNKIEAYILPGGVSSQLLREIGAGRPGHGVRPAPRRWPHERRSPGRSGRSGAHGRARIPALQAVSDSCGDRACQCG